MDVEDMFILTFLHKTCKYYSRYLTGKIWLELSGGPIIDKYISASRYVQEIYHSAYTSSSVKEIQSFLHNENNQYNWSKRFQFVDKLENNDAELSDSETDDEDALPPPIMA